MISAPPCAPTDPHTAEKGAKVQAIERLRGGPTTKIHALTEGCRRAVAFSLSPGNRADIPAAAALPDKLPPPTRFLADKGYDANRLRARLKNSETIAVIPATRSRKVPIPHDALADTRRNLIERAFCRRKDWRRIATRYHKPTGNFAAAVAIAAVILWWT